MKIIIRICLLLSAGFMATFSAFAELPTEYGIYWFQSTNDYKRANEGPLNYNYYSPHKKTMIFVHGHQNNAIPNDFFENFDYAKHDPVNGFTGGPQFTNVVKMWKDRGWNVGVFYWREFADDFITFAEGKVWSPHTVPHGMRTRVKDANSNVSYVPANQQSAVVQNSSVSDLFVNEYLQAMASQGGGEIRIVGHSLGNQLVVNAVKRISDLVLSGDKPHNINPDRIALLDPFYSNLPRWYFFGATNGEVAAHYAQELKNRGMAIELYRYSLTAGIGEFVGGITFDDGSLLNLRKLSAHQDMRPWYIGLTSPTPQAIIEQVGKKHISAPYLYFQGMGFDAPAEVTIGGWTGPWWFRHYDPFLRVTTGNKALSAATPTWRVRQMMTDDYYWNQVEGRNTNNTNDDVFARKNR